MTNIFSYKDQNAGLNALGYKDTEDEEVKRFNAETLKEYQEKNVEQNNFIFNVYSPEETEKIQNKGKADLLETAQKHRLSELVPYYGSGKAGLESIKIYKNLEKLKKGELLTDKEKEDTRQYIKDTAECELRGRTFGGSLIDGLYATTPFLFEAGIGFMAAGALNIGVGLSSLGQTASKYALRKSVTNYAKKEIRKQLEAQARKNAVKKAKQLAFDSTIGLGVFSATTTGTEWLKTTGDILLTDDIAVSERGQYILNEAQSNPAKAVMLALGDTMIENFSETTGVLIGGMLGSIGKVIDKTVLNRLPKGFAQNFRKLAEKTFNKPYAKVLRQYGYHGMIEEMGEERTGDFLRVTLNMDGEEGYSFDQFMRALFPDKEQLAQEAILFSLMGGMTAGGIHGTKKAVNYGQYRSFAKDIKNQSQNEDGSYNFDKMKELIKQNNPSVTEEQLEKTVSAITDGIRKVKDYSLDDFLVDAGLFKSRYKESITDKRIRNIMKKAGADEESIGTVLNYADNKDKAQLVLSSAPAAGMSSSAAPAPAELDETKSRLAKRKAEVEEQFYNKLIQGEKDTVLAAAEAQNLASYFVENIPDDENAQAALNQWINKLSVRYNIPAEGNTFHQSANTAGAKNNEIEQAKKEWQEKGVESKYFKKWFGDSKVVDEQGKPLVVYHGTGNTDIEVFDENKTLYGDVSKGFTFFTNKKSAYPNSAKDYAEFAGTNGYKRSGKVYEVYLKIQKPLHIKYTSNAMTLYNGSKQYATPVEYYDANYKEIKEKYNNSDYDGIIIENTDKNNDDSIIYLVPSSEQIKSVNNQGTFNERNPNIYYQKVNEISESNKKEIEGYKDFVNRVLENKLTNKEKSRPYVIGDTPQALVEADMSNEFDNIVDLSNEFDKTPTLDEVKAYINEVIEEGTKFATLSPDWFIDIKGGKRTKGKILNKGNYKGLDKAENARHNKYLMSLEKLLSKAEYAGVKENTKKDKKPNVAKYHYFKTNVKIGGKVYQLIFDTEEYINENPPTAQHAKRALKPLSEDTTIITDNAGNVKGAGKKSTAATAQTVHLYNIKEIKKPGTYYQDENANINSETGITEPLDLADTNENGEKLIAGFTYQEVLDKMTELYTGLTGDEKADFKITKKVQILEDAITACENQMKFHDAREREDLFCNAYYIMKNQEIPENYINTPQKAARIYSSLKKIHDEKKAKAQDEYLGYFSEGKEKTMITIMSNHDKSTILHECGHLFLNGLNELASVSPKIKADLEKVNKWLGADGTGEYTVKQQEKFARSYEAYLYKGKAPNSALKRTFEKFKEWLKSAYLNINNLADKGADISDEAHELFTEMFAGDSYAEDRKAADELLKKVKKEAKKIKVHEHKTFWKELDEVEKRHKDVSYEILSAATGKSAAYLKTIFETGSSKNSFGKKRENIQELIDAVEDKITASGGMRESWKEFYSGEGVGYENQTIDGDYNLAMQAFETIINKAYRNPGKDVLNEMDERAEYYEKAVDNADREYRLILREYKNGNRNAALAAFYDWNEALNEELKEDYEDRFIYDTGMIERAENTAVYDKAKRKIMQKARELDNQLSINKNEKYKELVKETVKDLSFLNPYDKARLTANILDVPSTEFLISSLDNIMDIAQTMEDVRYRRELERKIHVELKGTKNYKKNGRTVGKYDYRSNKIFEALRRYEKLSQDAANDLLLKESHFAEGEDNGLSYKNKLINMYLSYKAGGRTYTDTEMMKKIYDEIIRIKLIGKSAKSELELIEKLEGDKDVDELIDIVEAKPKKVNILEKAYINGIANLESTINAVFGKDIMTKYATEVLYAETQAQAWQYQQKKKFTDAAAEIYNLPKWNWDFQILKYLSEKHVYQEIRRKYDKEEIVKTRLIDREMTHMDIICAYIWSKNAVLEKRLINQFGEETLNSMFDELSLEDVKLAELMMNTAQSFYPAVNRAFINKYGLDLPKVSCYFPSTPERGSEIDLYNEYSAKSLNNGFTKARAQTENLPMDFHNPVEILFNHIEGVAKFTFMSDSLDKANLRFRNADLKRAIINKYGKAVYQTLEQELINITYKKEAPVFSGTGKVFDNMISNWITGNIAIKPVVGLKQLLSATNYSVDMPVTDWTAGFVKSLADFNNTIDYMMKIPYINARFHGNYSNEFLKQTIENSAFAASQKLKDACTLFVKIGDIGAIIFGGKPYIDYLITKKGMTEEEAIKQFIISTNRSQQSSLVSSLSNFQVAMTRNPFGKLFIAFKNAPQQYIRMCGDAIISCKNGDMSKTQLAKTLFQFGYLQPFLYTLATSGALLRFLFAGEPDDVIKDFKMSVFDLNSSAIPFFGEVYKYAVNRLADDGKYIPQSTPLLGDIEREINRLSKEDITLKDIAESLSYMTLHIGLGYNGKAIINTGSGLGDIFTGSPVQGAMKLFGYTDKRAKRIAGKE